MSDIILFKIEDIINYFPISKPWNHIYYYLNGDDKKGFIFKYNCLTKTNEKILTINKNIDDFVIDSKLNYLYFLSNKNSSILNLNTLSIIDLGDISFYNKPIFSFNGKYLLFIKNKDNYEIYDILSESFIDDLKFHQDLVLSSNTDKFSLDNIFLSENDEYSYYFKKDKNQILMIDYDYILKRINNEEYIEYKIENNILYYKFSNERKLNKFDLNQINNELELVEEFNLDEIFISENNNIGFFINDKLIIIKEENKFEKHLIYMAEDKLYNPIFSINFDYVYSFDHEMSMRIFEIKNLVKNNLTKNNLIESWEKFADCYLENNSGKIKVNKLLLYNYSKTYQKIIDKSPNDNTFSVSNSFKINEIEKMFIDIFSNIDNTYLDIREYFEIINY